MTRWQSVCNRCKNEGEDERERRRGKSIMGSLIRNWFPPSPECSCLSSHRPGSFLLCLVISNLSDRFKLNHPFVFPLTVLSFWRSFLRGHLSVDPITQVFPSTLLFRNLSFSCDFDARPPRPPDRRAISFLSNSSNQNDLYSRPFPSISLPLDKRQCGIWQ